MSAWLFPALGSLLLVLLAVDVFRTVFHAKGGGGPVNRRQNRAVWKTVRWVATIGGGRRDGVLSLAGPLMAITTIALWSLLLLSGFTFVYLPFIHDFHFSPGTAGPSLLEAFYYSGIVTSTLGHGDVVAADGFLRALTVLHAMTGFAFITVAVTYVLAVYRELIEAQTLASAIHARLEARGGDAPDAPDWDRTIAISLAHAVESHHNFPILHYFRPARADRSVPFQVARLRRHALESDGRADSIAARALPLVISQYVDEVHALFVRGHRATDGNAEEETRLADILGMMVYDRESARV